MRKLNLKKVAIAIILIIMIIVELLALGLSRAEKVKEISLIVEDLDGNLTNISSKINAFDGGESGYYIILPEMVEMKRIKNWMVTEKSNDDTQTDNETTEENTLEKTQSKMPGDKIFVTEEELTNLQIELKATYDTKTVDEINLYNRKIIENIDESLEEDVKLAIQGYMPLETILEQEEASKELTEKFIEVNQDETFLIKKIYNIKLTNNEEEYITDEKFEIEITNISSDKEYKVFQIKENGKAEEITDVTKLEDNIYFGLTNLEPFVIFEKIANLEKELPKLEGNMQVKAAPRALGINANVWDGTIGTKFAAGDGTLNSPYLISNGEEFAYLAQQVNNGTTFDGQHFKLTEDINLDQRAWTPIGTHTNSFRGIFDGQGHTIGNAQITIPALATTVNSYGIFGSIGGGNNRAEIRNVEFNNININITATGTSANNNTEKGYNIGIVTGTIFRNATVKNVIVKASSITDSNTVTIRNTSFQVLIGGIAGDARNTNASTTDPGGTNRYSIDNCYVQATIDLSIVPRNNNNANVAQYYAGGIIGRIRSQPVWPTNCLYEGQITTRGLIGPIFGALRNNTAITSTANYATLWNGNDSGNLTMTDSYYTDFRANNTTFTSNETTGTSASTISNNLMGSVQGVNKGLYTNAVSNRLNNFNSNAGGDYVSWKYENSELSLIPRLSATMQMTQQDTYEVQVSDPYNAGNYTYEWYINGQLDQTTTGTTKVIPPSFETDYDIYVIVKSGNNYAMAHTNIPRLYIEIGFNINEAGHSATAYLTGTALPYVNMQDYTFTWYCEDITGTSTELENNSLTITNLERGYDYRLVATNNAHDGLSVENSFFFGTRTVIYLDYNNGNNNNNGFTPQTAVRNLQTAYSKLSSTGTRNENIIVMMGNYTDTALNFYNTQTNTTYAKKATITGEYGGVDYNGVWRFGSTTQSYYFRYLTEELSLVHLTLNGGGGYMYLICQGHSFTVGEDVTMTNYTTASTTQGLIGSRAPGFHVFAGWYQYNRTTLPNNNCNIILRSGTYGRVVLGGTPGTSTGQGQTTSHDFMGSSMNDAFNVSVLIDIKNSTTAANYDYDVNLLVGGSACGNNYSRVTENIVSGRVGRICGGSIGDSADKPTNFNYPLNTFLGETTINVSGGSIQEIYGGCLGRNMDAVATSNPGTYTTVNVCDSYFYGTVDVNVSGGTILGNIYGAGAGGVTGYSTSSSDPYKNYGQPFDTSVNINISNGTINGNIYGGGYGYTEYLHARAMATDAGALYGDSNITISGSPTINGNVYAAGCGYNVSSKPNIAQMTGDSNITITGTPAINGQIYGAGAGVQGYSEMAKLIGSSNIAIGANLSSEIYGGGNIAKVTGTTNLDINSGTHTGNIYGGGNIGIIDGTANVTINNGTSSKIFGGGNRAETTTTNVYIKGGETAEVYGGGNLASVTTTNVFLQGGEADYIFAGSNESGNVAQSNVTTTSGTADNIYGGNNQGGTVTKSNVVANGGNLTNVYGGNNQGGITTETEVRIRSGNVPNAYGGGNRAETTHTNVFVENGTATNVYGGGNLAKIIDSKILVSNGNVQNVYGGGNLAGVDTNTEVKITGGTVEGNVYGGGNEGTVTGATYVDIDGATIEGSVYAGGNGSTATVLGNSNITVQGNSIIGSSEDAIMASRGSVFGGGNAAATGTELDNDSNSTVNISGGTIYGNVYGGANTSVVYGYTNVNIGYDAIQNTDLEKSDIYIRGTVFGGGEANAAGSEEYDFSFISVTEGININIDGNDHTDFEIEGSIFGSGNASSTSGYSYILIKNYGAVNDPRRNVSIQRATTVTLDNSAIVLTGTTDRTNEYSTVQFTLSRIDELKLRNNSTVYLNCGANLLKKLTSLAYTNQTESIATVQIDEETGVVTKNVDNRIYMYEGKSLNIATNEQVTAYGEITGMTFLGLYTNTNNPSTSTGLYNYNYDNGDEITNEGTFSLNSYVLGRHKTNHDTGVDGFYTNTNNEGNIKLEYVEVTPEDDLYYIWLVGESLDVKTFEITLTASKYATLGTQELPLTGYATPNIKFQIVGFAAGLENNISLINGSNVEAIAQNDTTADTVFGLSMKSGKNGWSTANANNFYTADGGYYDGSGLYASDNSNYTPSLSFYLYHSQNLTQEQELGSVRIRMQVMEPIDDLTYDISYIDIVINMSTALFQDNFYEAAISPGEEFDLFTTTETTITNKSIFSTYYSLLITDFTNNEHSEEYPNCKRVLVSRNSQNNPYVYKQNTKIVMLDMATNKYYYYIVTANDELNNVYKYELNKFIEMGSTNSPYNESNAFNLYYDSNRDLIYENFIFHIDVSQSNITTDAVDNSLLIELQNEDGDTLIGVLGIQRDTTKYSIYTDKEAIIDVSATCQDTIYLGRDINLNVTTNFIQEIIDSKTIYDTEYFDSKMGIEISIYDNNGNKLNSDSLLGVSFIYDNRNYYPRVDGSVRIKVADRVSNVLSRIKISTEHNTTIATGTYTIKVETFGSPDGIYYGLYKSGYDEREITIINEAYGLKVSTDDTAKIVDKTSGKVQNGNQSIVAMIEYSSMLDNPNISVELKRRKYDAEYSNQYETVDFKDYFTNQFQAGHASYEYSVINNPAQVNTIFLYLDENLVTGTYKLVFKLYDDDNYIGEAYEYFIVK